MKIFIGADHRGYDFKERIKKILKVQGHSVTDAGTDFPENSCDYPQIAKKVATKVAKTKNSRGILLCMSGIGQAIAANKVKGAYAALVHNVTSAKLSRQHNNSNILVMGSKFVRASQVPKIVKTWLTTPFEGGRHERRFKQVQQMERDC